MTYLAVALLVIGSGLATVQAVRNLRAAPTAPVAYWPPRRGVWVIDRGGWALVGVFIALIGGVLLQDSIGLWALAVFVGAATLPRLAVIWAHNRAVTRQGSARRP